MARRSGMSLRQLRGEAARCARFYFDPAERARMLEEAGGPPNGDYAVLAINRFVPVDAVRGCTAVLRKFVRGRASGPLDTAERQTLEEYWRVLDADAAELTAAFEAGEPTARVKDAARGGSAWPAVGVADSADNMRALLTAQFEAIRHKDIAWRCVDSGTYPRRKPDGMYVLVDWFWHGG